MSGLCMVSTSSMSVGMVGQLQRHLTRIICLKFCSEGRPAMASHFLALLESVFDLPVCHVSFPNIVRNNPPPSLAVGKVSSWS